MGSEVAAGRFDTHAAPAPPASVARAVVQFVVAGLVAVVVFVAGSLLVLRELGHREAVNDARTLAVLAGQGIVEPVLGRGLLSGDPAELGRVDRIVQERVLNERVTRVKIWTGSGRIVYSDEPRLIGAVYRLGADEREALATGETKAELSDLEEPENRFERGQGDLYEVYTRLRAPDGTPLLFETYQRGNALVAEGRDVWLPFAVPVLATLVLLGVVQDLAGLSYSLSAAAERAPERTPPAIVAAVTDGAASLRAAIRQLRTLLVEIHPPNLRSAGLEAALRDLLAPLAARGVTTRLDVPDADLDPATEQLLFRAAGEAIRNVQRHAEPTTVEVAVSRFDGRARLEVADDGAGFAEGERERQRAEGHVGLTQ